MFQLNPALYLPLNVGSLGRAKKYIPFLFDSLIISEKVWIKEWGALGYMPKFEIKRTLRVNVLFWSHMVKGGYFFLCFTVQNLGHPYWLTLAPMYIWFIIFFIQPHKEERVLFPVCPFICLCGAVALSALLKCYHFVVQQYRLEHDTVWHQIGWC